MNNKETSKPKVSVSIITFNHEEFIGKAIESVLMQKTDFDVEILIGEDDSSDNTRQIVNRYGHNYPDQIRVFLHNQENKVYINGRPTGRFNFVNNLRQARGKYIALLEGDDYWTDPYKLHKQVDFLDKNPDFSTCFHWVKWLDQDTQQFRDKLKGPSVIKPQYDIDDLLQYSNFIPTCSAMYRNGLFKDFPEWFWKTGVGDFPLHFLNARHGKIGLINECMAVYRSHKGGAHGGRKLTDNLKRVLDTYAVIASNLNLNKRISYRIGVVKWRIELFRAYRDERNMVMAFICGLKAFYIAPYKKKYEILLKLMLRTAKRITNKVVLKKNKKDKNSK